LERTLNEGRANAAHYAEQQSEWNRQLTLEVGKLKADNAHLQARWQGVRFVWPIRGLSVDTWEN
jgi:hypothetical protein